MTSSPHLEPCGGGRFSAQAVFLETTGLKVLDSWRRFSVDRPEAPWEPPAGQTSPLESSGGLHLLQEPSPGASVLFP